MKDWVFEWLANFILLFDYIDDVIFIFIKGILLLKMKCDIVIL